ncbi:MAG: FecR domain-containing protein [Prevotella sp.]|jgi:hypothetical protein|nr:FecR domain-containing protein [Prevotella sp.]
MSGNTRDIDYSNYSFQDFLQDEFFVFSIKEPTKESEAFWASFLDGHTGNIGEFILARQYLLSIITPEDTLSEEEISDIWDNISSIGKKNRKRKGRKLLFISASVAAIVAVIALSFPLLMDAFFNNDKTDVVAYACKNRIEAMDNSEIQLVVSDEKTILFDEKETTITYGRDEIKTEKGILDKEESVVLHQLVIPGGKRSVLILSDGTKLWANAGSRVVYPTGFEKDKREIYVDGEVYIEVAKDAKRPFWVKTKDMDVQALGTSFNVTAYEADALKQVVLVSGAVKVETKDARGAVLSPNSMFQYLEGNENIMQVDAEKYTSWVKGLYLFHNETLGAVFKRLSRYYGVRIDCSPKASAIKCSGKLDLKDNIEDILKGLSFDGKITCSLENDVYKINKSQ